MSKKYQLLSTLLLVGVVSIQAFGQRLNSTLVANSVIDLSQPMYEGMPFWPGGVPFKMERLVDYDQGYQLHKFSMGENTGTHIDAPSHFIKGKWTLSDIPLNNLILPMAVINVTRKVAGNPDYELTVSDIRDWEYIHGLIPKGSLVVMNTGWHKKFSNPKQYVNQDVSGVMHFPGFSLAAAKFLIERDVSAIGIDTLSLDNGMSKTFGAHVEMLKNNKYQIENMANLDNVPAIGATAIIGVLPVQGGSQAQARVFALLP